MNEATTTLTRAAALPAVRSYVESGRLVPLGIVQKERAPLLPNVPTLIEQGFQGAEVAGWFGVFGPKGLSSALAKKINSEINAVLALPDVQRTLWAQGEVPVLATPEAFQKTVRDDFHFFGKVIRQLEIKAF